MPSTRTVKSKAEELVGKGQSAIGDFIDDPEMEAGGKARQLSGKISYSASSLVDTIEQSTKKNPIGALLVAGLFGLLLGRHLYKK